jgi:hypothetical protein
MKGKFRLKKYGKYEYTNLICSPSVDTLTDDAKQRTITVHINFKHCSRIGNHRFILIDFGKVEKRR